MTASPMPNSLQVQEHASMLSSNKLRAPGAREKKQLLLEAMDRKERPFLIVGDIKPRGPGGPASPACASTKWAPLA